MIASLIEILCRENGDSPPVHQTDRQKDDFFRSLCNVRPPLPISETFLELQDQYLTARSQQRGIVDVTRLKYKDSIALWQGDITRLNSEAIVNGCKPTLLGCFHPLHNCIDNVIHSNAGVQVRRDCHKIMQGAHLPNGEVVVTPAYNLPGKYIFHTVGPIVRDGHPSEQHADELSKCYRLCIEKATELGLTSLTFCCLSTGEYGYPKNMAVKVAVMTVRKLLHENEELRVIFNVFQDEDKMHYEQEL